MQTVDRKPSHPKKFYMVPSNRKHWVTHTVLYFKGQWDEKQPDLGRGK
jgi:hypothetical protein